MGDWSEVKWSEVAQSFPTLCDLMDCSLPRSSIHGNFQARVLEWVAISFSRGSSQPRDQTLVSRIVGRRFTVWATRKVIRWVIRAVQKSMCLELLSLSSVSVIKSLCFPWESDSISWAWFILLCTKKKLSLTSAVFFLFLHSVESMDLREAGNSTSNLLCPNQQPSCPSRVVETLP